MSSTTTPSAGKTADKDVEEGYNGIDNTGEDSANSIDDRHQTGSDSAEEACDL